jgi:hypothetical protein
MADGYSAGSAANKLRNATIPPADAPITEMSRWTVFGMAVSGRTLLSCSTSVHVRVHSNDRPARRSFGRAR